MTARPLTIPTMPQDEALAVLIGNAENLAFMVEGHAADLLTDALGELLRRQHGDVARAVMRLRSRARLARQTAGVI